MNKLEKYLPKWLYDFLSPLLAYGLGCAIVMLALGWMTHWGFSVLGAVILLAYNWSVEGISPAKFFREWNKPSKPPTDES